MIDIDPIPRFLVEKVERAIHAATHPTGMHTNGPAMARIEASQLAMLLRYATAAPLPRQAAVRDGTKQERIAFNATIDAIFGTPPTAPDQAKSAPATTEKDASDADHECTCFGGLARCTQPLPCKLAAPHPQEQPK